MQLSQCRFLISACLLGQPVRYDGRDHLVKEILEHLIADQYVTICPEISGGLPTPRPPAEIQQGHGRDVLESRARIFDTHQQDVTEAFLKGAYATLALAQNFQVTHAILKSKSPSCGNGQIYDGHFSGQLRQGDGVTAALLKQHGIQVLSEQEFLALLTRE